MAAADVGSDWPKATRWEEHVFRERQQWKDIRSMKGIVRELVGQRHGAVFPWRQTFPTGRLHTNANTGVL